MSLKEKFQITAPGKINAGEPWADFSSARVNHGEKALNNKGAFQEVDGKFNYLPPGMCINEQVPDVGKLGYGFDGEHDVTKNDADYLHKGYSRAKMGATDDQYTGEHIDLFYGEAYGDDGEVGFLERNNYLDRE